VKARVCCVSLLALHFRRGSAQRCGASTEQNGGHPAGEAQHDGVTHARITLGYEVLLDGPGLRGEERKHRWAALRMRRKQRRRSTQLQRRVRAYSEVEGTVPVEALDVCERPSHFAAVAFAEDGALSTGRKPL
jgi:hypothetical protein